MTLPLGRLAALGLGLAALALPSGAAADTVTNAYTTPGTYNLTIPPYTTSVNVIANGGGGEDGAGGALGGVGSEVNETVPIGPGTPYAPGDTLQVIVGARGGGGAGGAGNELGGPGGNGGGVTAVADTTGETRGLAVAGGGGGGGGHGGILASPGGAGGQGSGRDANGLRGSGTGAGAGGDAGTQCAGISRGGAGGSATIATGSGGGGGGGDGACGGNGGAAAGAGGTGGGGGGAGASLLAGTGIGTIGLTGFNHDGNVTLYFARRDVAPRITSAASAGAATGGSFRFQVTADGAPAAGFTLSGAPSWLAIDPASGVISGTVPPLAAGRFTFTVTADNGVGPAAAQSFALDVTGPRVVLAPPQPVKGNVGLPVMTTLAASGGAGPITWSLASGQLPAGLSLTPNGQIAGTPAQTASATVTVRATDSASPVADSATEPVTVVVAPRTLAVSSATLPGAMVGGGYEQSLAAAMSIGTLKWSLASGTLPPGLVLVPIGKLVGTPTAAGTYAFTVQVTDATGMTATGKVSLTVQPQVQAAVYVVNGGNSSVRSFALGATGNASPLTALAGLATGLNGTSAVAIAPTGRVYVASANNQSIREYPYGASGNAAPDAVIAGPTTGLNSPQAVVLDGKGRLYVANAASNSVTVYAPGATGDARPIATLSGAHTGLSNPSALTIDGQGHLWVANQSANSLTEYPAAPDGDVAPLAAIAGFATRLNGPQGLALDSTGNLLVADTYDDSIAEYSSTANGNVPPIRRIAGTATGLSFPVGIDVDATGNLYVSNQFGGVEEFLFPANGNRTPLASIAGSATGLSAPGRLAVAPPLSVATASLPRAREHARYRAVLRADLGTTPYRWTLAKGELPPGLRLRDGRIEGRPRRDGTYRFTVRATDASRPAMQARRRLAIAVRR